MSVNLNWTEGVNFEDQCYRQGLTELRAHYYFDLRQISSTIYIGSYGTGDASRAVVYHGKSRWR